MPTAPPVLNDMRHGRVNLNDPAVTLALPRCKAVVGLTGHRDANGGLASVGIQCSLCHSTVDNSSRRASSTARRLAQP
jgi:hypothetical protein